MPSKLKDSAKKRRSKLELLEAKHQQEIRDQKLQMMSTIESIASKKRLKIDEIPLILQDVNVNPDKSVDSVSDEISGKMKI